jgi:hypothetical protein
LSYHLPLEFSILLNRLLPQRTHALNKAAVMLVDDVPSLRLGILSGERGQLRERRGVWGCSLAWREDPNAHQRPAHAPRAHRAQNHTHHSRCREPRGMQLCHGRHRSRPQARCTKTTAAGHVTRRATALAGPTDRLPVRGAFVAFLCVCTSVPALSWGQYRPGTNQLGLQIAITLLAGCCDQKGSREVVV